MFSRLAERWTTLLSLILAGSVVLTGQVTLAAPAGTAILKSAGPSFSAEVAPSDGTPEAAPISGTSGSAQDAAIADRIRGIFAELERLRPVKVRVFAGVVTLTGTLSEADDIERAETIASRMSGVVTVENKLKRDLAVERNLSPVFGGLRDRALAVARGLPLAAVALVAAALIALIGHAIARRSAWLRRIAPNVFLAELIATSIRVVFVVMGIVVAFDILGATALLGAVLGGAGVIGIALGFAVRDTVDNYVSSLMLSVRQPFRANDSVLIDGQEGRVARLTSRATILVTPDGNQLRIPNSTVFKAVIVNFTRNPERRFTFDVIVDAAADPIAALRTGGNALRAMDCVLAEPRARGLIADLAERRTVLRFEGWVDQRKTDFAKARGRAIATVKHALDRGGFALPPPVQRVRIEDNDAEGPPAPVPSPAPAIAHADADTSPEEHLKAMVDAERSGDQHRSNLLDPSRPHE